MKKILSFLLAMTLVITMSAGAVFANETAVPQITDVTGTPYGTAVNSLVQAGIVDGYPDGTYRPENAVKRAEACKLIYSAYVTDEAGPEYNAKEIFSDLSGYGWASQYIGWAASEGIVVGDGDGTFRPGDNVTVNEFLTMLVRAGGLETPDMVWPDDYVATAQKQGLTDELVDIALPADGEVPASRGNCAIMIFETGVAEEVHPETPAPEENIFTDFSGKAFGFILENGKVLNANDDVVDMVTFYMGANEFTLMARKGVDLEAKNLGPEKGLICLQISKGEITDAYPVNDAADVKTFDGSSVMMITDKDSNDVLEFYKVTGADENYIFYDNGTDVDYLPINSPSVIYVCTTDGGEIVYEGESYYGQIDEECYIAAFTANPDDSDLADVIIVVDPYYADSVFANTYFAKIEAHA